METLCSLCNQPVYNGEQVIKEIVPRDRWRADSGRLFSYQEKVMGYFITHKRCVEEGDTMRKLTGEQKKIPRGLRSIENKILDHILEESDDFFEEDEYESI